MADENGKIVLDAKVDIDIKNAQSQLKTLQTTLGNLTKEKGIKILDEKALKASFSNLEKFKKELLNISKGSSLFGNITKESAKNIKVNPEVLGVMKQSLQNMFPKVDYNNSKITEGNIIAQFGRIINNDRYRNSLTKGIQSSPLSKDSDFIVKLSNQQKLYTVEIQKTIKDINNLQHSIEQLNKAITKVTMGVPQVNNKQSIADKTAMLQQIVEKKKGTPANTKDVDDLIAKVSYEENKQGKVVRENSNKQKLLDNYLGTMNYSKADIDKIKKKFIDNEIRTQKIAEGYDISDKTKTAIKEYVVDNKKPLGKEVIGNQTEIRKYQDQIKNIGQRTSQLGEIKQNQQQKEIIDNKELLKNAKVTEQQLKSFEEAKNILRKTYGKMVDAIGLTKENFKYTPTGKLSSKNNYLQIINDKIIEQKGTKWIDNEGIQKRQQEKVNQLEQQRIQKERERITKDWENRFPPQQQIPSQQTAKRYWINEQSQIPSKKNYWINPDSDNIRKQIEEDKKQAELDRQREQARQKQQQQASQHQQQTQQQSKGTSKSGQYWINQDTIAYYGNQNAVANRPTWEAKQYRERIKKEQYKAKIEAEKQEKQYQVEMSAMKGSTAGVVKAFDRRIFEPIRAGNNALQAKEIGGAVTEVEQLVAKRLQAISKDLQLTGQGLSVTGVKQNTRHGITSITQVVSDVEGKITGKIVHDIQQLGDQYVIRPGTGSFIPEITAKQKALQRYQQKLGQQIGNIIPKELQEGEIQKILGNARQYGMTSFTQRDVATLRNAHITGNGGIGSISDPALQQGMIESQMREYYQNHARERGLRANDVQVSAERRVDNATGNAYWQTTTNIRTGRDTYTQYRDAINESTNALHRQGVVVRNETNRNRSMWTQIKSALVAVPAWYISMTAFYGTMRKLTEGIGVVNEINKAMTEVAIVTQSSTKAVSQLKTEFVEMADNMKVSIQEVLGISADLFRQGLNGNEVKERMKSIIEYSKISSLDLKTSTEIITAALNTTGASANHLIDVMSYLGKILPLCMVTYICKVSYIGGKLEAVNPEERPIIL